MVWNDCCPISFVYSICLFSWILDELFQFVFLFSVSSSSSLVTRELVNVCFGALACRLSLASLLLLLEASLKIIICTVPYSTMVVL